MANILIVDDSRIFRKILSATLTKNGYEVVGEASNGEEALNLLAQTTPDIVTLDITMPVMDGLETLEKIKEGYPNQKVIMVSAAGQKNKVMTALKNGACDFLQKPFQPEDVIEVIKRSL